MSALLSSGLRSGLRAPLGRLAPQPVVGAVITGLALLTVAVSWIEPLPASGDGTSAWSSLLSLCLVVAAVAAYQFPIHVRHCTKIGMASVAYYLMAVLLPPPLAATAAGVGALTGELSVRKQRGTYPSDVATAAARRVPVVFLGALVAHLPGAAAVHTVALVAAAAIMESGDIVTYPLVLAPICGERPFRVMALAAREAYLVEGAQYLLGLLGALAAAQQVWALIVLALPTSLVYLAFKSAKELHDSQRQLLESTRELLESMADAVDLRDPYTGGHSRRVTALCAGILRELEVGGAEEALILSAARVHDIGKIGIPDAVLNKPGPLSAQERALMELHAEQGANLLRRHKDFAWGVEIVLHHHEAWDGTGYPHRLQGEAIPLGARVIAVADSFDAMTTERPYQRALSAEKAAAVLRQGRGRQWDPALVDALLRSIADRLERSAPPLLQIVPDPAHSDADHTAGTA